MPRSATPKIGASWSLLMAMMFFEPFMPTMCCVAPEMPQAMYTFGLTTLPVWPTCIEYGTQPASTIAREAPAAPLSSLARSSIIENLSFSPSPRPPDTTIAASSSFGPVDSSTCTAVTLAAPVAPSSGTGADTTSPAPAAPAAASNDFGRNAARNGPEPVNVVVTIVSPPNTGVVTMTASPSMAMSTLLVSTVRSSLTDSRPITSRPS